MVSKLGICFRVAARFGAGAYTSHLLSKSFPGSNRNQLMVAGAINTILVFGARKLFSNIGKPIQTDGLKQPVNKRYQRLKSFLIWGAVAITPLFFTFRPFNLGLPNYPTVFGCLSMSRLVFHAVGDLGLVIWPVTSKPSK